MNFLAHCLIGSRAAGNHDPLSPSDGGPSPAALLAGGFLGDFIKGRVPEEMPWDLALGVRLHRRVDAYSNTHPDIRVSSERFPRELRRLAPILVDILCDHLLTRRWSEYHHEEIGRFTGTIYTEVAALDDWLPDTGARFLTYAREKDLLARYGDWSVAENAMLSITRRLGRTELNPLINEAVPPLLTALEDDFQRYFPDILDHARQWIAAETAGEEPSRS
jgi:acyl carrier protein phosphodiesterase